MSYPTVPRVSFRCRSVSRDKVSITCQGEGIDRVYISIHNGERVYADVSLTPALARAVAAELTRQANLIEQGI